MKPPAAAVAFVTATVALARAEPAGCSPCTAPCTAALLAPLMAEPAACNPWPTASRHGVVVALTASPASLKACDMAPLTSCCQLLVMLRSWASLKLAGAERSQSLPAACSATKGCASRGVGARRGAA